MAYPLRFTVYFYGTGNNKYLHALEGANVARPYELDTAKGTNLAYNSGLMPQKYDANDRSGVSEQINGVRVIDFKPRKYCTTKHQ